jgi:20S proteasome subunit beta 3
MSILEYNGAAMIAMAGKNCVGIAADRRLGQRLTTIATDFQKVFQMSPKLFVGLAGLATDVQTLHHLLEFRLNLYKLREERDMTPEVFTHLLSTLLYEKRFGPYFCEPIVAGLDDKNQPFLGAMDLIGAGVAESTFVVSGTCTGNLYGMCESLYQPDMDPDQLFETLAQALLSSVDRDALSGWGGVVHIITPEGVRTTELKGRQD